MFEYWMRKLYVWFIPITKCLRVWMWAGLFLLQNVWILGVKTVQLVYTSYRNFEYWMWKRHSWLISLRECLIIECENWLIHLTECLNIERANSTVRLYILQNVCIFNANSKTVLLVYSSYRMFEWKNCTYVLYLLQSVSTLNVKTEQVAYSLLLLQNVWLLMQKLYC